MHQTVPKTSLSDATMTKSTRTLLSCGVIAGPLYVIVGAIEMLTRPGYDPTRHDLSLMSNGSLGWIHISLFILTGMLTIAGGFGLRQVLRGNRGGNWGPILLGIYGLGLIGAGFFIADPAHGFPPGTPPDANAVSWHGLLHFVSGALGFIGLIAACFVLARSFATQQQKGWALYSVITGVLFFAAFVGIAVGSSAGGTLATIVILAFDIAVVIGWTWFSLLSLKMLRE